MFARGGAHALLIAIVLGCSAVAVAQAHDNKNAARELYTEGTRLYDLNDYGKALDAFRKAYLSFEEPTLLFNIAQCQRQLHQTDEAIKTYRSFLRKVPNASNRGEVTKLIAKLEETLEKERQASKMPPQEVDPKPAVETPPVAPVAAPTVTPVVVEASPVVEKPTPVYKKWWLWTIVGVVVVGAGVGAGVGVALSGSSFKRTLPDTGPGASSALGVKGMEIHF